VKCGKILCKISDVVLWGLETLRTRLDSKHKETFSAKATNRVENSVELFRYGFVTYLKLQYPLV